MRNTIRLASVIALACASPAIAQSDTLFSWSKHLPDGGRLAIRNLNGIIDVRPGSTDRVEIRAFLRPGTREVAGDLTVELRERSDSVDVCTIFRGQSACDQLENGGSDRVMAL